VSFSEPWLLVLVPVVLVLAALRLWRPPPRPALAVADARPATAAASVSTWRIRARWLPGTLRVLVLLLLILALARPRQGLALELIPEEGIDIVVALDVSSSMIERTPDGPSRLEAAKTVIEDFVDNLAGDRVGFVVFQSRAIAMSPLTLDHEAIGRAVQDMSPGLVPDGTAIGLGLAESLNLLRESPARSRVVVLLTDGQNNAGEVTPVAAADLASVLGIRVYTVGFLAAPGDPTNIDAAVLAEIAEKTGGRTFDAATGEELAEAYDEIGRLERSLIGERRFTAYREFGPLLAAAALALLVHETVLRSTWLRRHP
jgi:Ca-activated chloride channel family protein